MGRAEFFGQIGHSLVVGLNSGFHSRVVEHAVVRAAFEDAVTQEVELGVVKAIGAETQVVEVDALFGARVRRIDGISAIDRLQRLAVLVTQDDLAVRVVGALD